MASCGTMKKGEIYACADCGFEVEVKKECNCPEEDCTPNADGVCCDFECCGKPMQLKK